MSPVEASTSGEKRYITGRPLVGWVRGGQPMLSGSRENNNKKFEPWFMIYIQNNSFWYVIFTYSLELDQTRIQVDAQERPQPKIDHAAWNTQTSLSFRTRTCLRSDASQKALKGLEAIDSQKRRPPRPQHEFMRFVCCSSSKTWDFLTSLTAPIVSFSLLDLSKRTFPVKQRKESSMNIKISGMNPLPRVKASL